MAVITVLIFYEEGIATGDHLNRRREDLLGDCLSAQFAEDRGNVVLVVTKGDQYLSDVYWEGASFRVSPLRKFMHVILNQVPTISMAELLEYFPNETLFRVREAIG